MMHYLIDSVENFIFDYLIAKHTSKVNEVNPKIINLFVHFSSVQFSLLTGWVTENYTKLPAMLLARSSKQKARKTETDPHACTI